MIHYDNRFLRVFSDIGGNLEGKDSVTKAVLNSIESIKISATGGFDARKAKSSILLRLVSVVLDATADGFTIKFTMYSRVPGLSDCPNNIITVSNVSSNTPVAECTHGPLRIKIRYNSDTIEDIISIHGSVSIPNVNADIRLKSLAITPDRSLSLFGSKKNAISNGYNVSLSMDGNVLNILGTAGAGIGRHTYPPPVWAKAPESMRGIRSINGLRSDKNVNIEISEKLKDYGAYIK